jgi:hypothetical protein
MNVWIIDITMKNILKISRTVFPDGSIVDYEKEMEELIAEVRLYCSTTFRESNPDFIS